MIARHNLNRLGWTLLLAAQSAFLPAGPLSSGVSWWVDNQSPACSDLGTGSTSSPFCTIGAAATRAFPGDMVLVKPGVYREQITPPISGGAAAPITYQATDPGVILRGTSNLSDAAAWSPTTTAAWSRPYSPSSPPTQVFIDGARLSQAPGPLDTIAGSFFYDASARVLYVDTGGGNPAAGHSVEAGARTYGFDLTDRSHVIVQGFEIENQNHTGINLFGSTGVTVRGTTIRSTGVYGILCETCAAPLLIENCEIFNAGSVGIRLVSTTGAILSRNVVHHNGLHGIELQSSGANQILENRSFANLKPAFRSATGIDLNSGSNDNLIRANTTYQNDDTGVQIRSGSSRNLVVRNASWQNGDHGFDVVESIDNRLLSNTSAGNLLDGFSAEGGSTGTILADNISVNNGATTHRFDLFVDSLSTAGSTFDFDTFWNAVPGPVVKFAGVVFASVADFAAATGQETHGLQADPLLRDASAGDLRLTEGSPAIDAADSSPAGFSLLDHDGRAPVDLFAVPDSGAGDLPFADRGAFEFDIPPVAALAITPPIGTSPLAVIADGSGSGDPDSTPVVAYTFDFGDGTIVGPQAGSATSHTYPRPGDYAATLRVVDAAGLESEASSIVEVRDPSGELPNLRFLSTDNLAWDGRSDALSYNLYRGPLGAFTDTDKDGAADSYGTCLMSALASTAFADAATPPAGAAFFYLVTARYAAGEGTLGFASSGAERPNTQPCP